MVKKIDVSQVCLVNTTGGVGLVPNFCFLLNPKSPLYAILHHVLKLRRFISFNKKI